jgi:6-phosphogluconolactonase
MRRTLLAILSTLMLAPLAVADGPKMWAFIGTYTGKKSQGIYRIEFDSETGKLGKPELAAEVASPSFLAIHPNKTHLFAVCEISNFEGKKAGGVASFTLDPKTGELKAINQQSSVGPGPCHVVCDATGKFVLAANYGGGSTVVLPVGADGKLGEASAFVQHPKPAEPKGRQEAPHAHSVNLDKANTFAVVADLGLNQLLVYKFDPAKGTITANTTLEQHAGAGPRHFAFHPNGKYAYTCNELDSSVTALTYDAAKGELKRLNTLSTLPEPTRGNSTAEVVVHPSGKFVYVSNRGHNSIAVFTVNESTGELTAAGHQGEGVKIPRNFNVDPTGKWMLVCNQAGDSVIVYSIDPKTGALKPTDQKAEVGSPVCVKFVPKG